LGYGTGARVPASLRKWEGIANPDAKSKSPPLRLRSGQLCRTNRDKGGWSPLSDLFTNHLLRKRSGGWLPGCAFVVLWINDEAAVRAFTFALGVKVGFIAQG
jgi:hypothetical protein